MLVVGPSTSILCTLLLAVGATQPTLGTHCILSLPKVFKCDVILFTVIGTVQFPLPAVIYLSGG